MKYINKYETESAALATSGLLAPQLVYVRESTDVLYSGSIPKFDEVVIEREGNELVINPKPVELDYFYLQPLSGVTYTLGSDMSDIVYEHKSTFQYSFNKKNWTTFGDIPHSQVYTKDLSSFMTEHPTYAVLALDITAYNTYVVTQGLSVCCYHWNDGGSSTWPGSAATLLDVDSYYAFYYFDLGVSQVNVIWTLCQNNSSKYQTKDMISLPLDEIVIWDGTERGGLESSNVIDIEEYDSITIQANQKIYLRNTGGFNPGPETPNVLYKPRFMHSVQNNVDYNVGGILATIFNYENLEQTLGINQYGGLFNEDSSSHHLVDASDLKMPTVLSNKCCSFMFYHCSKLIGAPELVAETLTKMCYYYLFYGCTSLNYVKCLAKNVDETFIDRQMLDNWLWNVSASGTFYKSQGVDYLPDNRCGIPTGWTIIDEGGTVEYNYVKVDNSYIPEDKDIFVFINHKNNNYYMFTNQQYNSYNKGTSNTNLMSTPSINVSNGVVSETVILSIDSVYYNGQTYTGASPLIIVALKRTIPQNTYEFSTVKNGSLSIQSDAANRLSVYGGGNDNARWTFVNPGTNLLVQNVYFPYRGYLHTTGTAQTNGTLTNTTSAIADSYLEIFKRESSYV